MSTPEQTSELSRSRVKLTMNAKGETQVEVSVRAGDTDDDVFLAQKLAQDTYLDTLSWLVSNGLREAKAA